MIELDLIKLGGSVITDKRQESTPRLDAIGMLAEEIAEASKTFDGRIIVGHGSGSFAHVPAKKYQTKEGLINENSLYGMAVTENAARKLNSIVIEKFLDAGLPVFSFSPASFLISDAKVNSISDAEAHSKSYLDPIKEALKVGVIPVVYGDVIVDKKIGCTIFSTETVLSILARELREDHKIRVIYCTDVNGVYDSEGRTISEITPANFEQVKKSILGASTVDVTGGMLHKVEEALALAKETGIETLILNGKERNQLRNVLTGNISGDLTVIKDGKN